MNYVAESGVMKICGLASVVRCSIQLSYGRMNRNYIISKELMETTIFETFLKMVLVSK
jgi:hypothetical protein